MSRMRLSQRVVTELQPRDKYYEIADAQQAGLLLRVQPSGEKTFYFRYRLASAQKRLKLATAREMTVEAARTLAKRKLAEVLQGLDPAAPRETPLQVKTLAELLPVYQARVRNKTTPEVVRTIKNHFSGLLHRPLAQITAGEVEQWRGAQLDAGKAVGTVNRRTAYLRAALNKAVLWGFLDANPMRMLKQLREDTGKPRFLTPEEEARLMSALEEREEQKGRKPFFADHLKPMILLALHTGARRGEIFGLEWRDVDIANATITLSGYKTKSGRTRHVPLNSVACKTMKKWQEQTGSAEGLVFRNEEGEQFSDVYSAWDRLVGDAAIKNFRWHDLRHHFASRLVQRGASLTVVRELLGHSSFAMTLRYAYLSAAERQSAVALLE